MQELYYPSHDEETTIHAYIWEPKGEVKGVIQILHGMAEYATRYTPFAQFLTEQGFAVVAEDHLGHGHSVKGEDRLGYFCQNNGVDVVLADIRTLTEKAKKIYPQKPIFLIGHSMGSFFARVYMAKYGQDLSGTVLLGTGWQHKSVLRLAQFFTKCEAKKHSWQYRSSFINNLAFGSYNKKFKPNHTEYDWLSVDSQNIQNYIADPLCGVPFTCNGFATLFAVISRACNRRTIRHTPKNIPILLLSGGDDPVGSYGKGVEKTYKTFLKANQQDVSLTLYRGFRHELLNDSCAEQVQEDILAFIHSHLNPSKKP